MCLPREIHFRGFLGGSITMNDAVFWKLKIHVGLWLTYNRLCKRFERNKSSATQSCLKPNMMKKEPCGKNHQVYFTQSIAKKHLTLPPLKSMFCALKVKR